MKAEPQPTRGVNRDSGTDSDNGCWLRRLVRRLFNVIAHNPELLFMGGLTIGAIALMETVSWLILGHSFVKLVYLMFRGLL